MTTAQPRWMGGLSNLQREHGFEPLRIEGRLPPELEGTLYRNGAGIFDRFGERCRHWFDADAALTAVRIRDGKAQGATRIHRTPAFEREERAGRRLFGGWNTPMKRPLRELFGKDTKNPSSTAVLPWRGKLLTLCEGGKPVEMDPEDLRRVGETDLGAIRAAFSAHPHRARGAIYNIGLRLGRRTRITVYEMREAVRSIAEIELDRPLFIHDFIATDRYLVIPVAPWRLRLLPFALGRVGAMDSAQWLDGPAELIVIPLDEPSRIQRIEVPPHLVEHVVAACDDGPGRVRAWVTQYRNLEAREGFLRGLVRGEVERPLGSRVTRLDIDVARGRVTFEDVGAPGAELPSSADGRGYMVGYAQEESRAPWDSILAVDLDSGAVDRWVSGGYPGEPLVAGDYLLTLVYDPDAGASAIAILPRARIGDGPVAKLWFDQPIPFGFHGCWIAA